jgi:hypothetical protein
VFTEYAQFQASEALDTVLPTLNRSGGWLLVLSTPLGLNHYHRLRKMARDSEDWWTATRTIADTAGHDGHPLIDPGLIERELQQGQRLEWLNQEYRCQFVVGLVSSISGDLLTKCEQEHRTCDLPRQPDLPTLASFDLGVDDLTVCTWAQENGPWLDLVDVEAWQNLSLAARIGYHTPGFSLVHNAISVGVSLAIAAAALWSGQQLRRSIAESRRGT